MEKTAPPILFVLIELEQEFFFVAAMSQVPDVSWDEIAVCSSHNCVSI
jgi:hypothetical protein